MCPVHRVIARLALVLSLCLPAATAMAQDRPTVYLLQTRLAQDGHYQGDLDGVIGQQTHAALAAYAAPFNIAPDWQTVISHMILRAITHDRRAPLPEELAEARAEVRRSLRDPESGQFRDEWVFEVEGGLTVCGEVNGRNLYGAYVGFQPYSVTFMRSSLSLGGSGLIPLGVADLDADTGDFCALGTSIALSVIARQDRD